MSVPGATAAPTSQGFSEIDFKYTKNTKSWQAIAILVTTLGSMALLAVPVLLFTAPILATLIVGCSGSVIVAIFARIIGDKFEETRLRTLYQNTVANVKDLKKSINDDSAFQKMLASVNITINEIFTDLDAIIGQAAILNNQSIPELWSKESLNKFIALLDASKKRLNDLLALNTAYHAPSQNLSYQELISLKQEEEKIKKFVQKALSSADALSREAIVIRNFF